MRHLKKTLLAALTTISLGVALMAPKSPAAAPRVAESKPAVSASTPAAPVARSGVRRQEGLPTRDWRVGTLRTYEVRQDVSLGTGEKNMLKTTLSGLLDVAVVGMTGSDVQARVQLRASNLVASGRVIRELQAAFEAPSYAIFRADGTLQAVRFMQGTAGDARRMLLALLGSLQAVSSPSGERSFVRVERDATGEFEVGYQVGEGRELLRQKKQYLRIETPSGLVPAAALGAREIQSAARFTFDEAGWPATLTDDESARVTLEGVVFTGVSHSEARLVETREARELVGSFERDQGRLDKSSDLKADFEAARENMAKNLVNGATYGQLRSDLREGDARSQNRAVVRMGALFKMDPAAVAEARASLLDGTAGAEAGSIISALGSAGTPEAQRALADTLAAPKVDGTTKVSAAVALGMTEQPTNEAQKALADASSSPDKDISSTATLAQGNLVKNAGTTRSLDAGDVVSQLIARLSAATSNSEQALCLDALGNAGDPRAEEAIMGKVYDEDPEVRGAAVRALRYQRSDRAQAALLAALADPDASIRLAAIDAIVHQPLAPFLGGLGAVLRQDPNASTRQRVVRVLGRALDAAPDAEAMLVWVVSHDPAKEVREAATEALSRQPRLEY